MTPMQIEIAERHKAFHAKIAAKAKPDPGITCASVSVRVPAPEIAPPDPAVIFAQWLERQAAINPIPAPRKPRHAKSGPKPKRPFVPCEIEPISIRLIQQVVAFEYGITMVDMFSSRRMGGIVFPRQVAMYLAKVLTVRSLPDIGRRFGGRDHTTILHAVRKISALVKADPELRERLERLALELGGSLT